MISMSVSTISGIARLSQAGEAKANCLSWQGGPANFGREGQLFSVRDVERDMLTVLKTLAMAALNEPRGTEMGHLGTSA